MPIRPAIVRDVAALDRIALASKAHWGYTSAQMSAWEAELRIPPDTIESRPTFVAEVDGELAGYAQLDPSAEPWDLAGLWVLPEFMGRGIGRALLSACAAAASRSGETRITIDADPHAERFYLACGATHVGQVSAPTDTNPDRVRPQLVLDTRAIPLRGR